MFKFVPMLASAALILSASQAMADIEARFIEGAPTDRFTISNQGACNIGPAVITINLQGSASGLIFDVTDQGAGVQVFQPLRVVSGASLLSESPTVKDGDTMVSLSILGLEKGQSVAFTIDVDDTMGGREITVSGSEIAGAAVQISANGKKASGDFNSNAVASAPWTDCAT